jgi:hypothetical protein
VSTDSLELEGLTRDCYCLHWLKISLQ